ncbi:head scaffolding protein [Mycobacterium phage Anthony]|uniref:Scaffolding protein n=1 Tax=Mycobacterium phage Anthony TaxID=2599857 RepID=A0A5J6TIG1_9CAUD|nr:head scaffolding protein [Mycobacterium phage Anthony]QFG10386.1 scaffolding protein [Mycobacterium phage Anthony]
MSDTLTAPEGTEATPEVTDTPLEPTPKVYDETYVKGLRQEAAKARVDKKDAVDTAVAALKATHAEELAAKDVAFTELQNQLGDAWIELEKLYTSIDAKVPSDKVRAFVGILQGTDKDSIQASAKSAYELAGGFSTKSPAFDPSQGLGGGKPLPLNGDPILNAMTKILGI